MSLPAESSFLTRGLKRQHVGYLIAFSCPGCIFSETQGFFNASAAFHVSTEKQAGCCVQPGVRSGYPLYGIAVSLVFFSRRLDPPGKQCAICQKSIKPNSLQGNQGFQSVFGPHVDLSSNYGYRPKPGQVYMAG